MKSSPLGAMIEAALDHDTRYRRHRAAVQYLCCYQTPGGRIFAFERVTKSQITLWLPEDASVRSAAEKEGLQVTKSVPLPNYAETKLYGRISSLMAIPEMRDASLYRVVVTSVGQAIGVIGALA